jgi:hypothetical protein
MATERPEALSLFVPVTALAALVEDDMDVLYEIIAVRAAELAGMDDATDLNRALQHPNGTQET